MNVTFGLVKPVIVAMLGAFIYVPGVIYLNGQTSIAADTCQVAFALFLVMSPVDRCRAGLDSVPLVSGAGLFGGAAMGYSPKLVGLPHESAIVCAVMGLAANSAWWLSVRNPAREAVDQL